VEGKKLNLPPILIGSIGIDPKKLTLLVYGHYDVQPAEKDDGWDTEPFNLVEADDGRLIGRGSTDDKGPIIGWLWAVEAHQDLGIELPINLIFCFEGMEECGSEGLEEVIQKEASGLFKTADCVCISDNCTFHIILFS
jgi:Cys-Gly metallodipeptidase DUG1